MWSSSEHQKPKTKNKKFTNSSAAFADSVTPRRRSSDKDRHLRLKFQNMTAVFWVLLKHLVSHRQHILQWAPRLSQPVSWEHIVYLIFCVFHLTSMCMESGSPSSKTKKRNVLYTLSSPPCKEQGKWSTGRNHRGGTGEFGQISTLRVEGICLETECFLPWYMHVLCGSMTGACSEISPDQPCPRNLWIRNKINNHLRWFIFTNDSLTTAVKFVLGWILDRCSLWGDSGVSYWVLTVSSPPRTSGCAGGRLKDHQ